MPLFLHDLGSQSSRFPPLPLLLLFFCVLIQVFFLLLHIPANITNMAVILVFLLAHPLASMLLGAVHQQHELSSSSEPFCEIIFAVYETDGEPGSQRVDVVPFPIFCQHQNECVVQSWITEAMCQSSIRADNYLFTPQLGTLEKECVKRPT